MKNFLFFFLFVFAAVSGTCQSKEDYEVAMKNVQRYLNAGQVDHLCALFQPDNSGNCVWTDQEIGWILNCFGKIESARMLNPVLNKAADGRVYFKVKCSKRTIVLSCQLNELLKFSHFEFNDKSANAQRMLGQGR